MDLHLPGKAAIVTGGSKGIGLATVRQLLDEGVSVVAASRRSTPELAETKAVHIPVDLTTDKGARELVERATEVLGGIDILVNNVGVGDGGDLVQGALQNLLQLPDDAWRHTFDLHFYSALRVSRAVLPSLIERRGTIVNVSSTAARQSTGGPIDYQIAKAALTSLTKVIAEQFGGDGVRALTVSPGPVSTGVWNDPDGLIGRLAAARGVPHKTLQGRLTEMFAPSTGRITTPDEVARLIVFLASPNNITGTDYLIDGGIVKAL
ncbi:SDR family oxidoreductase [Streptomyces sp. MP131-18]|uniref:SDR family NAD(P)-dependent oxidoreductase n=1 Tax=Streptomyces sp. MP131-18 TaxID=1857892 RepID=UPI00097BEECA|nr:SDR family oxidoreductase [Streptomyces sp. MP131-18]ONK10873.1 3-oxoacyl-[acyl-carrier-protein] reductase FabG [Streptomyces sp. MP131-18]